MWLHDAPWALVGWNRAAVGWWEIHLSSSFHSSGQDKRAKLQKAEVSPAFGLQQCENTHFHLPLHLVFCPTLPSLLPLLADLSILCLWRL